ncbi:hypothetical protein ACP70R_049514 [Stipagrostis hirtigluma subsp. patula]
MDKAKTTRRKKQTPATTSRPPTTVHDLPDHLLKRILLLLSSHVSLLRAAAVCKRWRRIAAGYGVADHFFFVRHPRPHVLGHYHVLDPSYSAAPPPPHAQRRRRLRADHAAPHRDPPHPGHEVPQLHRRLPRLQLPRRQLVQLPGDLRAPRALCRDGGRRRRCHGLLLQPPCATLPAMEERLGDAAQEEPHDPHPWRRMMALSSPATRRPACSCASGYQSTSDRGSYDRSTFRFVHDGAYHPSVCLVSLIGDELRVFVKPELNHGGGASEWMLKKSLCLPEVTLGLPGRKESYFGCTAKIVTAGKGYVVLTPAEETWLFSVELRTMRVEREHSRNRLAGAVCPYSLETPPVVRSCVVRCKRPRICRRYHACICD